MIKRCLVIVLMLMLVMPVVLAQDEPVEVEVQFIELDGPAAEQDAEISGLAWLGDYLLLLAENPNILEVTQLTVFSSQSNHETGWKPSFSDG